MELSDEYSFDCIVSVDGVAGQYILLSDVVLDNGVSDLVTLSVVAVLVIQTLRRLCCSCVCC